MVETEDGISSRCTFTDATITLKLSPEELNAAMSAMIGMLNSMNASTETYQLSRLLGQGTFGKVIQADSQGMAVSIFSSHESSRRVTYLNNL